MASAAERFRDTGPRRAWWLVAIRLDRMIGVPAARRVAAAAMTAEARTADGWLRGAHRVAAAHVRALTPRLVHVPERWWTTAPQVAARRAGLALELDLRDNLQRTLFFTGRYEPAVTAFLRRELRRGDTVLDVGAHIGLHSLTAARRLRELGGGRVIAVEPAPDSAAALRRAAVRNGLEVDVVEAAAGARDGFVELRGDPRYDPADAGVRSRQGAGPTVARARVVALDDRLDGAGVDLVKIDVEGAEPDVLDGLRATLATGRVRALIVETKGPGGPAVHERLAAHGYAPAAELPVGTTLFSRATRTPPGTPAP
jgi:FkbM family methyltransferase